MNAPDSSGTPEPHMLSEARLTRLREVVTLRLRDPSVPDDDLRAALHEVAAEARSRSLRPEALIVALKHVIADIEESRPSRDPDGPRRLQEWLVTTCIQSYFDHDRKPPADSA